MITKEKAFVEIQELVARFNEQFDSKIDFCENKINKLVYQLYELTEEEIKIVEGTK